MKITKITPEQQARFGEWSQKWIEIGLSIEPADFNAATVAALRAYKLCNLAKPMVVLRMGSPYGTTLGGTLAWLMLRELFGKQVSPQVSSQVSSQVWSQVGSQVGSQVWSQVGSMVSNYRGGQLWGAGWSAYVSLFRDIMGWRDPILERFRIDEELVRSCGWVWWHENVLAISDKPRVINRDDRGRLHCETGPSIAYRDGWSLHHWHGTAIPAEWVTGKKPSAADALKWPNIEQRRAACEIVGWHNVLGQLKAKIIDKDQDPSIGTLLEVVLPDAGKQRFLRVMCGTGREFCLPMPPEVTTARQANAWSYGLDARSHQPEVRT